MSMLVKHLRDSNRKPYGTIVAIDEESIGISLCNKKDRFNKKLGTDIAAGRAATGSYVTLPSCVDCIELARELGVMEQRAKKYYR